MKDRRIRGVRETRVVCDLVCSLHIVWGGVGGEAE